MESDFNFNLSDYSYRDLLHLFKLTERASMEDLKSARRIVANVHPDKCGLGPEYFRFFLKAYHQLENLLKFKNKDENVNIKRDRDLIETDDEEVQKSFMANLEKAGMMKNGKVTNYFSKMFNDRFEKDCRSYIESNKDNDDYIFLKSNDGELPVGIDSIKAKKYLDEKKRTIGNMQLVNYNDMIGCSYSDLLGSMNGLSLREAYGDESIIPITEEEERNATGYKSIDECQRVRGEAIKNLDYETANRLDMENSSKKELLELENYNRWLYEVEAGKEATNKFRSNILQIANYDNRSNKRSRK